MELDEIEILIVKHLTMGLTQEETSNLLLKKGIKGVGLSSIEKKLKVIKKKYNAKTLFHLGIIFGRMEKKK